MALKSQNELREKRLTKSRIYYNMKTQVYNLHTKFNFGKHKGKSLLEVIESGESRYIGYLVIHNVLWFVLHPDTIMILDKRIFFDNLIISDYGLGGAAIVAIEKEDILSGLKKNFDDYNKNPIAYEEIAIRDAKKY